MTCDTVPEYTARHAPVEQRSKFIWAPSSNPGNPGNVCNVTQAYDSFAISCSSPAGKIVNSRFTLAMN